MKYMLDTNICISSITYAELVHGAERSQSREKNRIALTVFLSEIQIVAFDDSAAQAYGVVKTDLQKKGTPIGPLDTLIASHAKSLDLTLVTNNTREFARVEGLKIEDWERTCCKSQQSMAVSHRGSSPTCRDSG